MEFLLIFLAIIAGVIILVNPFIGLLATIALIPQALIPSMSGSFLGAFSAMTPIKIVGALTFLGTVLQVFIKNKGFAFIRTKGFVWYTFFLIYLYISGFAQPTSFSRELFTMFTSFWALGFAILALVDSEKKFRWIVFAAIASITLTALISIVNYFAMADYQLVMSRMRGTAFDPNYFAIAIIALIPLSFYSGLAKKNIILKTFYLVAPVILMVGLVLTQSRGALVGLAVMLFLAIFRSRKKGLAILLVAIVAIATVFFMPQSVWERFEKTRIEDTHDDTIGSTVRRYYLALAAWEMFLDNPVFGTGPGNYYYNCRLYYPIPAGRAHTMYLEIMAEMGAVGIVLFLGVLFSAFKALGRTIKRNDKFGGYARGLWLGLAGFMVTALFLHAQQEKTLWLVVFFSFALERISQKQAQGEGKK